MKFPVPIIYLLASIVLIYSVESLGEEVTENDTIIPVNLAYSGNSLWTKAKILERFDATKVLMAQTCNKRIALKLNEVIEIKNPELQEIDSEFLSSEYTDKILKILGLFDKNIRPTLIYLRKSRGPNDEKPTEVEAQSLLFGGPRVFTKHESIWNEKGVDWSTGVLSWKNFENLKPLHGVIVTGQFYINDFTTDAHELGHILLNDGGIGTLQTILWEMS